MVTSKRKIETEQDRFGGFEENTLTERSLFRDTENANLTGETRMFGRTVTRENDQIYSGRTEERIHVQPQYRKPKSTPLSEEDLMPTIKTMAYAEKKQKAESREALETKTKVMLAVYMAIVVLLAAIVIGTGIIINSMSASITRLEADIERSNAVIASQNIEIEKLDDSYAILGKAKDPNGLNMTEATGEYTEIDLIPFVESTAVETEVSAFERVCRFIQNLLGN